MLKTLSQASASFTFSFGAFAVPLAIFLTGDFHMDSTDVVEMRPAVSSASLTPVPVLEPAGSAEASTASASVGADDVIMSSSAAGVQVSSRTHGARVVSKIGSEEKKKKKKRKKPCLGDNPDIERLDADTFAVERSVIKYYGGHLREFSRLGHASMYKVDGKSTGFIVRGIHCGNDLHQAGLRNGDVIHAVNGKAVTNIPQALAAYTTLKGKDVLTLSITRKGQQKQMRYHLS